MLRMLKEHSKRQQSLDVSTAPSAGECKTQRLETAGVGAKYVTCEASSSFHEFYAPPAILPDFLSASMLV